MNQIINILLVEDEESHAILIRKSFENRGSLSNDYEINISVSQNIQDANKYLLNTKPDIIITDWILPDGKGIELLPENKEDINYPVIVMTSFGNEEIAVEALKAGALDYIIKSVDNFKVFPRIVDRALREWNHIVERRKAENELIVLNKELEQLVIERTSQLEDALEKIKFENFERKKTADELLKAKEEISKALEVEKELSELKSRFISMISHEYRTPLTVILTSTYLMEKSFQDNDWEHFKRQLFKIRNSIKTMTRLLEDVLIIGKSDAGKLEPFSEQCNLMELCEELLEEIKVIDTNGHNYQLVTDSKNIIVNTDESLLRQIIENLLSNSVKYSLKDTTIKIELIENEDKIKIIVTDKGIGISNEDIEHIFEPFHRGKNIGTLSGTGLGLTIVKRCADIIGAKIKIDSKINYGSSFSIIINKLR